MKNLEDLIRAYEHTLVKRSGRLVPTKEDKAFVSQIVKMCAPQLEFVEYLACCGEAVLFKVRDTNLRNLLRVLKIPRPKLGNAGYKRFTRSARVLARYRSPYYPTVLNLSLNPLYLLLDWTPGDNLRLWVTTDSYSVNKCIEYFRHILKAVCILHQKEVIHRDIRPDNIIISENEIKLIDFGLAKTASDRTVTRTGDALGVEIYNAPEFDEDNTVLTTAMDVFSLGRVFYFLFTKDESFETENLLLLGYPRQAMVFYQKACSFNPSGRFSTAMEMLEDYNKLFPVVAPMVEIGRLDIYTFIRGLLVLCAGDRYKVELFSGLTREELFPIWIALKEQEAKRWLYKE